jgi:DNA-binding MarR family transcriptional regulator
LVSKSKKQKNSELQIDINKMLHEPARLKIMAKIYNMDNADFISLKKQTGLSSGNLSAHLIKLEQAGYVTINKKFKGRRPQTTLRITKKGRDAFSSYKKNMIKVFDEISE